MNSLYLLTKILFWLSFLLLLIGLWKPWVVLWWLDYQNRLRVLMYYGSLMLVFGLLSWLFTAFK